MRRFAVTFLAVLLLSILGVAQENEPPRTTFFGGYSYLHNSNSLGSAFSSLGNSSSTHFNGWNGQATFNFTPHFGVTADINGNYRTPVGFSFMGFSVGTRQSMYNFLFGPTVSTGFGRTSVFGHALFGQSLSRLSAGVTIPIVGGLSTNVSSANAFAMAFGGGIDIGLSKHVSIRIAQLDYLRTQFSPTEALASGLSSSSSGRQNSFRYSGGIVFNF